MNRIFCVMFYPILLPIYLYHTHKSKNFIYKKINENMAYMDMYMHIQNNIEEPRQLA